MTDATIPAHGQVASPAVRGRFTVSATKQVREGFSARMLLLPGFARVVVELAEDTVRISVRAVDGARLAWRGSEQTGTLTSGAESFGRRSPSVMRSRFAAQQGATQVEIAITLVVRPRPEIARAQVLARADVRPIAVLPPAPGSPRPASPGSD